LYVADISYHEAALAGGAAKNDAIGKVAKFWACCKNGRCVWGAHLITSFHAYIPKILKSSLRKTDLSCTLSFG